MPTFTAIIGWGKKKIEIQICGQLRENKYTDILQTCLNITAWFSDKDTRNEYKFFLEQFISSQSHFIWFGEGCNMLFQFTVLLPCSGDSQTKVIEL